MKGSRVAVVGAGVSGLIAAHRLAQAGFRVTVFELRDVPGGLAATFEHEGTRLDRYFHFICPPDAAYIDLIGELELEGRLVWRQTRMGTFTHGRYHPFGTPASLLAFSPLPAGDKLRFALGTLRARRRMNWRDLDGLSAREWLVAEQGTRCYDEVWRPLLESKFGNCAADISAAWMWARINRVANSRRGLLGGETYGYLEGGTGTLLDALAERIASQGGELLLNAPVEQIALEGDRVCGVRVGGREREFDFVVSTVAPQVLASLAPSLPPPYAEALRGVEYRAVSCAVLITTRPLSGDYWLNINDPRIAVPVVINYTQLDPIPSLGGLHVQYVPLYLDPSEGETAGLSALPGSLDAIRAGFAGSVVASYVFRDRWAQPLYTVGYATRGGKLLDHATPVPGLFRSDMSQIYPHDRSITNAADHALRLVQLIVSGEGSGVGKGVR